MVSLPCPCGHVRRVENRLHLRAGEEAEHRPIEPLHRYGQRLLDDSQRRQVVMGRVLEERAQRSKPRIAATGSVLAITFEVIEEGQHELGVDVDEFHAGWGLAGVPLSELQQETEGVAVCRDGAGAYGAVVGEMLGEEALDEHGEARCGRGLRHRRPPRTARTGARQPTSNPELP
jgi:hypothetical protein